MASRLGPLELLRIHAFASRHSAAQPLMRITGFWALEILKKSSYDWLCAVLCSFNTVAAEETRAFMGLLSAKIKVEGNHNRLRFRFCKQAACRPVFLVQPPFLGFFWRPRTSLALLSSPQSRSFSFSDFDSRLPFITTRSEGLGPPSKRVTTIPFDYAFLKSVGATVRRTSIKSKGTRQDASL